MPNVLLILLIFSLVLGFGFAFLAYRLAVDAAPLLKSGDLRVGVGKFSVATGNALVALFLISAFLSIGTPLYMLYLSSVYHDEPVVFSLGPDTNPPDANTLSIVQANTSQTGDFQAHLQIFRSRHEQDFTITYGRAYNPISIQADYDWPLSQLTAYINGKQFTVPVAGDTATLHGAFELHQVVAQNTPPPASASVTRPQPISSDLLNVADPPQQSAYANQAFSGGNL